MKNQYEAMFLFDPTFGASFPNCEGEIRRLLERAEGDLLFCKQWDERRLAYKIKNQKRGVYVLTYFNAPAEKIVGLERDAKLSESVLRVLVLRSEDLTTEEMERALQSRNVQLDVEPVGMGAGRGRNIDPAIGEIPDLEALV